MWYRFVKDIFLKKSLTYLENPSYFLHGSDSAGTSIPRETQTVLFISKVQPVFRIMKNGNLRSNIHPGDAVAIILKKDQGTGALTFGRVADILTNSPNHPHGIKVRLADGSVGRVQEIY